ncbi:helix-turn-helix domain-containing protein [Caldicellulosiruptoraceae bacterium PP1]
MFEDNSYEKIYFDEPLLPIRIWKQSKNKSVNGNWHYHKEIEFLAILKGELNVYIGSESYNIKEGNVVLIGSSQIHNDMATSSKITEYIVLQFDLSKFIDPAIMQYVKYFIDSNNPLGKLNYIFQEKNDVSKNVFLSINNIYDEFYKKEKGFELAISIEIQKILLEILRNDYKCIIDNSKNLEIGRLKKVFEYVDSNIHSKIQITHVCKLANMSYYHFIKYFKKAVGLSFTDYVNLRKIKEAERILLTEDKTIDEVGFMIGMPNMAHFYKIFKKYNQCSPGEYKKKMMKLIK